MRQNVCRVGNGQNQRARHILAADDQARALTMMYRTFKHRKCFLARYRLRLFFARAARDRFFCLRHILVSVPPVRSQTCRHIARCVCHVSRCAIANIARVFESRAALVFALGGEVARQFLPPLPLCVWVIRSRIRRFTFARRAARFHLGQRRRVRV